MKIIADKNIVLVEQAFSQIGEVLAVEKDEITRALVRDADILLVRSETKVGEKLLSGSGVRFVGSPTSGFDHIDREYLARGDIGFAHAPGSNANSVMEYVLAALLTYSEQRNEALAGKTLGVVGVGNIGSIVAKMGRALGMTVLLNDPPRARTNAAPGFLPLDELMQVDFLTLHVPLIRTGFDATYHLFDNARIGQLSPDTVLLNTARGSVVDNDALKSALRGRVIQDAILDVWENEPEIDVELLNLAALATPHIAGYSFDGKVKGTRMIYEAACEYMALDQGWQPELDSPELPDSAASLAQSGVFDEAVLRSAVRIFYEVWEDDRNLRGINSVPHAKRGQYFWKLRRNYGIRREFGGVSGIFNKA